MKRYALLLLALVLIVGGMISFVALRPVAPAAVPPPPPARVAPRETVSTQPIIAPPTKVARPADPVSPAPEEAAANARPPISDPQEAMARIGALANTFDETHVPELARFLNHESAEVRAAAMRALLLVDAASAAPYLRVAAEQADKRADTVEAVSLREAADMLSTPRKAGEPTMTKAPLVQGGSTRPATRPIKLDTDAE